QVEPGELRARKREADLDLAAARRRLADVANDEPRLLVIRRHRSRDVRLLDPGIRIGEAEILDVLAELPLERAALALAEQVRLIEADEAADARSLAHGRAEVHVARALLLHVEDQVDVALLVGRVVVRRRHVLLEEAEVGDVSEALNELFLIE